MTATPPFRRSRAILLPGLAVAVLSVGGLVGWQYWAHAYELERGSMGGGTGGVKHVAGDVTETRLPLRRDEARRLVVSVRNAGSVPVLVTAVGGDSVVYDVEKAAMIEGMPNGACCTEADAVPFHPVDIPAGNQLIVFLTIRPDDRPWEPCSRAWFGSVPVRFSVLGIDREQRLPIDPVVAFEMPGTDCAQGVSGEVGEP